MLCDHCETLRADLLAMTLEYVEADARLTRFSLQPRSADESARFWNLKSQLDFARAIRDVAHGKLVDHMVIVHAGGGAEREETRSANRSRLVRARSAQ